MKNAVEIAVGTPSLSTLVSLLKAAGLVKTVQGLKNATIFAPTNDAFHNIPAQVVKNLLKAENKEKLQQILLTHVVSQELFSTEIGRGATLLAESGAHLGIHPQMGTVFVSAPNSNAKVIKADIQASHEVVIHVIDNVLMP